MLQIYIAWYISDIISSNITRPENTSVWNQFIDIKTYK